MVLMPHSQDPFLPQLVFIISDREDQDDDFDYGHNANDDHVWLVCPVVQRLQEYVPHQRFDHSHHREHQDFNDNQYDDHPHIPSSSQS